jgi:hypothetical protein
MQASGTHDPPGERRYPTDQELFALLELESAIQTDRRNHDCDCPEPDEELGSNR